MDNDKNSLFVHKPIMEGDTLTCTYSYMGDTYTNRYTFSPKTVDAPEDILLKLQEWISLSGTFGLFSLSNFSSINVEFGLTQVEKDFFEKLIFFGLAEFRVVNKIPLGSRTSITAPGTSPNKPQQQPQLSMKPLLLNGGGKDGSVSALLLDKLQYPFSWFQRGNSAAQQNVVDSWNYPVVRVERELDSKRKNGPYKGHRPMSAIIAFLSVLAAVRTEHNAVIASNESSANEANYIEDGISVNHQYSKSLEFESDIQELFSSFGVPVKYFSLLRPLHELQIAFVASGLSDRQLKSITSCNNGTKTAEWCMSCPKCAFVVLVMTASSPESARQIWGTDAINLQSLEPHLEELLDPKKQKPFECVGTIQECQLAAKIIVNRTDIPLRDNTATILGSYESELDWDGNLLDHPAITHSSDHLIPQEYRQVLPAINISIDKWISETRPLIKSEP